MQLRASLAEFYTEHNVAPDRRSKILMSGSNIIVRHGFRSDDANGMQSI